MPFLVSCVLPILWRAEIRVALRHRYQKSWRRSQGWFYVQNGICFISVDTLNFTITWQSSDRWDPQECFYSSPFKFLLFLQDSCDSDQHYTECFNKCLCIAIQDTYRIYYIIRRITTFGVWRDNVYCHVAEDFHSIMAGVLLLLTAKSS
jgi:hypothetical protein